MKLKAPGKQQSLHCSIVIDEHDDSTNVYHLSDDSSLALSTRYFMTFLTDGIFAMKTILLKRDNAGNQYKDKYAFAY